MKKAPVVHIVDNNDEDGDWVRVFVNGKLVVDGHSISQSDTVDILKKCGATVHEFTVSSDEVDSWEPTQ